MINLGIDISILAGSAILMLVISLAMMAKLGYDKDAQAHIFGWLAIYSLVFLTIYSVMSFVLDRMC